MNTNYPNKWFNLREQTYVLFKCFKMNAEFKRIDLYYENHIATSQYGGPIAITRDKSYPVSKLKNDDILIFDAYGKRHLKKSFK